MSPQIVIELITALAPVATNLIDWITKAQTTLKQSAEMTPEQEATLDALIASLPTSKPFQVDPDPAPTAGQS
jgi:hypothetical protein